MQRKLKGYKGPSWTQYVLKYKKDRGVSFRDMARECDMSDSAWYALLSGKGPPSYTRAEQLAEHLKMPKNRLLNVVFKDRILRWAKIEGILTNPPTPAVESLLHRILVWDPTSEDEDLPSEEGAPIGYIMSTFANNPGMKFARNIGYLPHAMDPKCNEKRNKLVRVEDFR